MSRVPAFPGRAERRTFATVAGGREELLGTALGEAFEALLRSMAAHSRALVGAHMSAVNYVPDGDYTRTIHSHDLSEKYRTYETCDAVPTIWGEVIEQGRSLRLTDAELRSHPRWRAFSGLVAARGLEHPPLRGLLAVPIRRRCGDVIGTIILADRVEGDFTREDEAALTEYAGTIGLAFDLFYTEANLARVIDLSVDGLVILDPSGKIVFNNPAALRLLGRGEGELDGTAFGTPAGASVQELQVRTAEGVRIVEMRCAEAEWQGVSATAVSLRDVTELKESQAVIQSLFDSPIFGVATADLDRGTILEANGAFLDMLGLSRADLAGEGLPWSRIVAPGQTGISVGPGAAICGAGWVAPVEVELCRSDGDRVPVLWTGSRIGSSCRSLCLVLDLSEQKSLVAQLEQALKLEAVGRLAGGVAHDFNNVLSAIGGYASLALRQTAPDDPVHDDLKEVQHGVARAAALTRQLLAFSRQQVLQPQTLDLNGIATGLQRMIGRLIGEDIRFDLELAADLGQIRADPGQLEQVLMNLCINARDAMPTGGTISIRTGNVELDTRAGRHAGLDAGCYVCLTVADDGVGMDAPTLDHIFEPFFTTKEIGRGTGLGLATVYGIVQQSEGGIRVDSDPGVGTRFNLFFPRLDGEVEPVANLSPSGEVRGGQEVVLLVEDEAMLRRLAERVLGAAGYQVLAAASAEEALACVAGLGQVSVDLLLTDVVMPEMSGAELASRLEVRYPGLKVLYMSGYTDDSVLRHGVIEAQVSFMQKPFVPDQLLARVRSELDRED